MGRRQGRKGMKEGEKEEEGKKRDRGGRKEKRRKKSQINTGNGRHHIAMNSSPCCPADCFHVQLQIYPPINKFASFC